MSISKCMWQGTKADNDYDNDNYDNDTFVPVPYER